ncbi:fumarylacetoacetate hydrolase family protein [Gilvimarinus sp. SDUM040013]|uniref:Fumarylacetoacetate hydrolase family protein n=1 Tax=Gilvimarinus gilvus TaxID=3058038 RepID=A0ABU4S767_9GAMM|nr:fumarylacetoacetate hydrolase family protein [Gilvimarinus sp. SDUM040013]MDO3384938.1 fumarylacetoacetate hydrolase family protein [Gilvimarinus sp. SDUM040013]MDX6851529.1 fumarylacetoacetate hydrolase family protein [Gilvimarinus sp. SDUM040013]
MKLLRVGEPGAERPAIVDSDGKYRDLSSVVADIDGAALSSEILANIAGTDISALPEIASDSRIGACVNGVGKFICIGLNYVDHCEETGAAVPEEPVVFMKATSAITGPNDGVIKPKGSEKLDWEVEMGIVIGRDARYVSEEDAMDYVAGFCVVHDVSERNFQLERGGQWDKGKGCDTFGPIGPFLVTRDEVKNPLDLNIWLNVNGKEFQNSSTKNMVFGPAKLVSYLSQFMSLQAGDIISTGTPPGVGLGQKPPVYLNEGDEVHLGIEGLGEQRQKVLPCPY